MQKLIKEDNIIETYSASQIIVMAIGTIVATVALYHAGKIIGEEDFWMDAWEKSRACVVLLSSTAFCIIAVVIVSQLGAVDVFENRVNEIKENMGYNVSSREFLDNIDAECAKIDDVDIYGVMKYNERDCNRMVFKRTKEKYMFLNGVTP